MNVKEQQAKEEHLVEKLKDPIESHSNEITDLINKTIRNKHKVFCATDWHLWKRIKRRI